jgi:hypothetical protein
MTTFLRLLEEKDKAEGLFAGCTALRMNVRDPRLFQVAPASFQTVPGAPFAYWVSEGVRQLFREFSPLEGGGRAARQGGVNGDDFRWLRLWLEQENGFRDGDCIGIPIAKGGSFSKYYSDIYLFRDGVFLVIHFFPLMAFRIVRLFSLPQPSFTSAPVSPGLDARMVLAFVLCLETASLQTRGQPPSSPTIDLCPC